MGVFFLLAEIISVSLVSGIGAFRYKYLGCYIDSDSNGRDIIGKDFTFSTLTLETCVNQCQPSGYAYAALQFATNCLCGNSYGRIGYSLFCNCTCDGVYCGGYQSNDVFYGIDNSLASQRGLVYHGEAKEWDDARMICVANNGDLSVINSAALINNVVSLVAASNSSTTPTNVWFGLHRRLVSYPYEWANENADAYIDHVKDFASFWVANDAQLDCVSINVAQKMWESKACTEVLPFVCDQLASVNVPSTEAPDTDTAANSVSDNPGADSNRLALYIVMPLFLLCYGGSCVLYCAYKIYRNCCYKKKAAMRFEPIPGQPIEPVKMGMGPPPGILKRPLSGGPKRSAVYPMTMENLVLKGGPTGPKYEPSGENDGKKEMGLMRKAPLNPNANNLDQSLLPPPNYFGGGQPGAAPPHLAPPPPTGDGFNNMSISEILKKKMMDKNNRGDK